MERIGFIGLGIMGKPMAANLVAAGYSLTVCDFNAAAVDELVAQGATAAGSAREVAAASDVVITMLPDSPQVDAVVLGPDGVAEGIREDALYIDMSSIAPATSRKVAEALAERGVIALDAPVSRRRARRAGGQPLDHGRRP